MMIKIFEVENIQIRLKVYHDNIVITKIYRGSFWKAWQYIAIKMQRMIQRMTLGCTSEVQNCKFIFPVM